MFILVVYIILIHIVLYGYCIIISMLCIDFSLVLFDLFISIYLSIYLSYSILSYPSLSYPIYLSIYLHVISYVIICYFCEFLSGTTIIQHMIRHFQVRFSVT